MKIRQFELEALTYHSYAQNKVYDENYTVSPTLLSRQRHFTRKNDTP